MDIKMNLQEQVTAMKKRHRYFMTVIGEADPVGCKGIVARELRDYEMFDDTYKHSYKAIEQAVCGFVKEAFKACESLTDVNLTVAGIEHDKISLHDDANGLCVICYLRTGANSCVEAFAGYILCRGGEDVGSVYRIGTKMFPLQF